MNIEHFEMTAAIATIGLIIVLAMQFQLSVIEGLGDISHDWSEGQNYKMAGLMHVQNQTSFGSDDLEEFLEKVEDNRDYCRIDETGFGSNEPLRLWVQEMSCENVHEEVRIPIYLRTSDAVDVDEVLTVSVGGKN